MADLRVNARWSISKLWTSENVALWHKASNFGPEDASSVTLTLLAELEFWEYARRTRDGWRHCRDIYAIYARYYFLLAADPFPLVRIIAACASCSGWPPLRLDLLAFTGCESAIICRHCGARSTASASNLYARKPPAGLRSAMA